MCFVKLEWSAEAARHNIDEVVVATKKLACGCKLQFAEHNLTVTLMKGYKK